MIMISVPLERLETAAGVDTKSVVFRLRRSKFIQIYYNFTNNGFRLQSRAPCETYSSFPGRETEQSKIE